MNGSRRRQGCFRRGHPQRGRNYMHHRRALVLSALAASLCLPSSAFALDEVNSKKLRDGVTVNGILQHERALPGDRQRQRGHARVGHAGLRGLAAVRQGPPAEGRLSREGAGVHVPVLPRARAGRAAADGADAEGLRDRARSTTRAAATSPRRCRRSSTTSSRPPARPARPTRAARPSDFAGFTAGNVALIQRGTCDFAVKADNAKAAGASAVIIFNEGQPGRTELFTGTLGEPEGPPGRRPQLRRRARRCTSSSPPVR